MLLFLAAIISAFWYLRNEEIEREQESVKRDIEIAQQQIRLRLIENQEQLVRIAREIANHEIDPDEFTAPGRALRARAPGDARNSPGSTRRAVRRASYRRPRCHREAPPADDAAPPALPGAGEAAAQPERAFSPRATLRQPVYSRPFTDSHRTPVFQLHVPLLEHAARSPAR